MPPMSHTQLPEFGTLLKRYRLDAALSQEQLAERSGLSMDAVSALERGARRSPHAATIELLTTALGLSAQERAALTAAARHHRRTRAGDAAASGIEPAPSVPLADLFPPARALPVPLTPLIGRERELAEVTALLRGGERLLVLAGPGGAGKTLLALAAARAARATFPDGVAYVPLAALPDPTTLAATHAHMLDVRERDEQPLLQDTLARLHGKRHLLLLDNYERIAPAAPLLADLCAACPNLTVLATSRAALHIAGAPDRPVPPLDLPAPAHAPLPAVEELVHYPAVRLFVERAQDAVPGFALTVDNAGVVVALCRRLEGLPLAVELAAARAALLPLPDLLAALEQRPLEVLAGGPCNLPPRQRSLRASLEWSYDALDPATQEVFRRLAADADGCTLEQAASACADIAMPEGAGVGDVFGRVATLVDNHLLTLNNAGGEPRLTMPALVRAYALQYVRDNRVGASTR